MSCFHGVSFRPKRCNGCFPCLLVPLSPCLLVSLSPPSLSSSWRHVHQVDALHVAARRAGADLDGDAGPAGVGQLAAGDLLVAVIVGTEGGQAGGLASRARHGDDNSL